MSETTEDVVAPAVDDQIVETTAPETAVDTSSGETAGASTAGEESAKSLLDVLSESIDEASKTRKTIQPKAEELAQDDSRPRNADGTFKTETPEEKAAREALENETPEAKAAREVKEAEAAKKPADHVNDPIPENTNKRTQERIKSLIETVKAQEALVAQHGELFAAIQGTGASPDEFATMVNYMKGVRSNDPKSMEWAYSVLQSELRGLAVKMGKPLYEVNLLRDKENADLVAEIGEGKITSNHAHEIALMREAQKTQHQRAQRTTAATSEADAEKAANTAADKFDADMRKRDGDAVFQAKFDILIPALKNTLARLPPADRLSVFKDAYDNLKIATPAPAPIAAPKPVPMRPKAPAGGATVSTVPKSAIEAMNAALGM